MRFHNEAQGPFVKLNRQDAIADVPVVRQISDSAARRFQLGALAFGLLWLVFCYQETLLAMVDIWNRSDTFAHGFVIAPISAWLIWRRRHFIHSVECTPSGFGILVGLAAGVGWLLGEIASVAAVSQFAFVGVAIGLTWAILGTAVVRTYAFPLAFLFFMVPFGEFMFPTMMRWTADFIIWAVRASGVPVYAEGFTLVIPSGRWEVVEGCSGVRYLMASIVVGSLYAYLNYRSVKKRVVFVAASAVVPILANWLRAYGIVMIGHLSDNRLAAGVDHLIYGWVFFGVIILALFWIGSRWQEEEEHAPKADIGAGTAVSAPHLSQRLIWLTAALVAVLLWQPLLGYLDRQGEHGPVNFGEIRTEATWQPMSENHLPDWKPSYGGMRVELIRAWSDGQAPVGLYIGYYRDQGPGKELINSENRVLISKHPVWKRTGEGEHVVSLAGRSVVLRAQRMASTEGERMTVWYGNWIGGRWTNSPYLAKVYLALSRLSGDGDDSAAVMIYTPYAQDSEKEADDRLAAFMSQMGPGVEAMLNTTAER